MGTPQVNDFIYWDKIPDSFKNWDRTQPDPGIIARIDLNTKQVYVTVQYWNGENTVTDSLVFELEGSGWDSTNQWKRDNSWGFQRDLAEFARGKLHEWVTFK